MKNKIVNVQELLAELVGNGNFNVQIMGMKSNIINHNSIYYKISEVKSNVPEESVMKKIYLENKKEFPQQPIKKSDFSELVKNYLPKEFEYTKENLIVNFEAGIITIKDVKINKETNHFNYANCDEVQIQLKHDNFVDMIEFEQIDGGNDPEFDFIMKNELRNSTFQIYKDGGEFHLSSQKFGFNTIVPSILPNNEELSIEVFNEDFAIRPGEIKNGKILFKASAEKYISSPQLDFVLENSQGDYEPVSKNVLEDLEIYFKGRKLKNWKYGDPLYEYPGIEYTFRLPKNNRFNKAVDGELLRENFHSCRLVASIKMVRLHPDFVLVGNFISLVNIS